MIWGWNQLLFSSWTHRNLSTSVTKHAKLWQSAPNIGQNALISKTRLSNASYPKKSLLLNYCYLEQSAPNIGQNAPISKTRLTNASKWNKMRLIEKNRSYYLAMPALLVVGPVLSGALSRALVHIGRWGTTTLVDCVLDCIRIINNHEPRNRTSLLIHKVSQ